MSSYSTVHVRKARAWFFGWGFQISRGREAVLRFNRAKPLSANRGPGFVHYSDLSVELLYDCLIYVHVVGNYRKLCILKGVFPWELKKKVKGNHHTYYHLKDVSFIQHEPLLEQLRGIRAYERKVKRADAKKNKERAALLKERRPTYKLDGIILQRFVGFFLLLKN
ncbi:pescadillo-like protein [Pyrus ussuriensis x Pyrus communis]|uniref:Pescadillo-like protein n=1 Tax=Pyrus ussuriensis x Pyrus communis TaxID=2448454 RepID=A0A5N5FNZ8_9ROSA|nr:pescadillo-like protein [Pyrus ussuriensis x Pyrus communis]